MRCVRPARAQLAVRTSSGREVNETIASALSVGPLIGDVGSFLAFLTSAEPMPSVFEQNMGSNRGSRLVVDIQIEASSFEIILPMLARSTPVLARLQMIERLGEGISLAYHEDRPLLEL